MLLILRKRAIKIVVVKSTICIVVGIIALLLINSQILTQIGVPVEVVSIGLPGAALLRNDIKRINVPNTMSAKQLISTIESLTMPKHPIPRISKIHHTKNTAA